MQPSGAVRWGERAFYSRFWGQANESDVSFFTQTQTLCDPTVLLVDVFLFFSGFSDSFHECFCFAVG